MNAIKVNRDLVVGGGLFILCVLGYLVVIPAEVELEAHRGLSPAFFPNLAVIWIGIGAGILLVKSLFAKRQTQKEEAASPIDKKPILAVSSTLATMVLYLIFCPMIGYILSTILTLILLIGIFGERRIWVLAVAPVTITIIIYVLFTYSINIVFP